MTPDDAPRTDGGDAMREAWRRASVAPLWESPTAHKPDGGPPPAHLWPWATLAPLVAGAAEIRSPEAVERRVLSLVNPRPRHDRDEATVGNIAAAIQILMPGESARPHRHSMNALRFMLQGSRAITVVDGKECPMEPGDLILTPGWCWHQHRHDGDGPAIWLDVLDVPLHQFLGTARFESGPIGEPPRTLPDAAFAAPNIVPDGADTGSPHSPVFRYPWSDAAAAVAAAPVAADGARRVRYVNPTTGGSAMTLLDSTLVQVDRAAPTRRMRTNANTVCLVVEGEGGTHVGDEDIRWDPGDIFVIPSGNPVSHRSDAAVSRLFQVSDREVYRRLGLLEETMVGSAPPPGR